MGLLASSLHYSFDQSGELVVHFGHFGFLPPQNLGDALHYWLGLFCYDAVHSDVQLSAQVSALHLTRLCKEQRQRVRHFQHSWQVYQV